jgi:plasmid stabilization system protein ParE
LFYAEQTGWCRHGVRPANHPLRRLRQYAGWVEARGNWPEALRALAEWLPAVDLGTEDAEATRRVRRKLADWCDRAVGDLSGGRLRGARGETWLADGALPLAAALTGRDAFAVWFHGRTGDQPARIARILRQLEVSGLPGQPHCQGLAQGLLGWLLEQAGCV